MCWKVEFRLSEQLSQTLAGGVEESKEEQEDNHNEQVHKKIRLGDNNHNGLQSEYWCIYQQDYFMFFGYLFWYYLLSVFYSI